MVYSSGFENRHTARYREFESHRLRIDNLLVLCYSSSTLNCDQLPACNRGRGVRVGKKLHDERCQLALVGPLRDTDAHPAITFSHDVGAVCRRLHPRALERLRVTKVDSQIFPRAPVVIPEFFKPVPWCIAGGVKMGKVSPLRHVVGLCLRSLVQKGILKKRVGAGACAVVVCLRDDGAARKGGLCLSRRRGKKSRGG